MIVTSVDLSHCVTILDTSFTTPDSLTDDLLILKLLAIVFCDSLLLRRALKQSDLKKWLN